MDEQSTQSRRMQALFEHCARSTGYKMDFARDGTRFKAAETEQLFQLWLSGLEQGVVDQAARDGLIDL